MQTAFNFVAKLARASSIRRAALLGLAIFPASCPSNASAQVTLAYGFESGLEGFGPNGGGITVTQDTIGATEGTQSMKVSLIEGPTFVGALTSTIPLPLGDPPGVEAVFFDITITEAFPQPGFVSVGVTIFGASQPGAGQQFGLQAQFADFEAMEGKAAGTYPVQIDLKSSTHPLTFATGQTFNDIFGTEGSGANDLIPTGFQIFINKSPSNPWTGYIDNIRIGKAPPVLDANFNDDAGGLVDAADLAVWRGAFGSNALGDADSDLDSDGVDFLAWQRQYNGTGSIAAVPEPATGGLIAIALAACWAGARRSSGRREN